MCVKNFEDAPPSFFPTMVQFSGGVLMEIYVISRVGLNEKKNSLLYYYLTGHHHIFSFIPYHKARHVDRRLNKELILKLASCTYILDSHNIILKGPTGSGK